MVVLELSGLRKRAQWERAWALQRREDTGEKVKIGFPEVRLGGLCPAVVLAGRGKLDVPKKRFISYPQAGRDSGGSELLGWAECHHLQQA